MQKKSTKKLFGLFAILFVVIFAVGCVFSAACGKKNDEESETEHVHAYTELNQGDANGHYYTCPDDGEKGEVTAHTYGEWTGTEADCVNAANRTRSCTVCGYVDTDTTAATGNHTYVLKEGATWAWAKDADGADDYSAATADAVCSVCGAPGTVSATVTFEGTEATCTESGEGTYTATYGEETVLTATVTIEAKGHQYSESSSVSWSWTGVTGATANVACDVCGETTSVTASVSGPTDGVYTATATTPANKKVKDTKAAPATAPTDTIVSEVIDFSDASTYAWLGAGEDGTIEANATSTDGLLTIPTGGGMKISDLRGGALNTNGSTSSSNNRYVQINLNDYEDYSIVIVATMCSNGDADRSLHVSTKVETPSVDSKPELGYVVSSSQADVEMLTYDTGTENKLIGDLNLTDGKLYLTFGPSGTINILTLEVYVYGEGNPTPAHEHTVTGEPTWTWANDCSSATATFTCTAEGCTWTENKCDVTVSGGDIAKNVTSQPTCGAAGSATYTATIPGTEYSDTTEAVEIPATGDHTYGAQYLTAGGDEDVETDGWYLVCSVCGDVTALEAEAEYTLTATSADSLAAALAVDGATVVLGEDIEMTESLAVKGSITLDLSGKTLKYTYSEEDAAAYTGTGDNYETVYAITVAKSASLTISDSSEDGTGAITFNCSVPTSYTDMKYSRRFAAIQTLGTLIIEGGRITSTSVGIVAEGGSVQIAGGAIEATQYSIFMGAGEVSVYIYGGTVSGGRGICVDGDAYFGYDIVASEGSSTTRNWQDTAVTSLYVYEGATIVSEGRSAISTIGYANADSTYVYIYGGLVMGEDLSTDGTALSDTSDFATVYIPNGHLYISGGTIKGTYALRINGGTAEIVGGEFISTGADAYDFDTNTGKPQPYAIAIIFEGAQTPSGRTSVDNKLTVTVSGGTFTGAIVYDSNAATEALPVSFEISGGTFSEDPSAYLAAGYVPNKDDESGTWTVVDAVEGSWKLEGLTYTVMYFITVYVDVELEVYADGTFTFTISKITYGDNPENLIDPYTVCDGNSWTRNEDGSYSFVIIESDNEDERNIATVEYGTDDEGEECLLLSFSLNLGALDDLDLGDYNNYKSLITISLTDQVIYRAE